MFILFLTPTMTLVCADICDFAVFRGVFLLRFSPFNALSPYSFSCSLFLLCRPSLSYLSGTVAAPRCCCSFSSFYTGLILRTNQLAKPPVIPLVGLQPMASQGLMVLYTLVHFYKKLFPFPLQTFFFKFSLLSHAHE